MVTNMQSLLHLCIRDANARACLVTMQVAHLIKGWGGRGCKKHHPSQKGPYCLVTRLKTKQTKLTPKARKVDFKVDTKGEESRLQSRHPRRPKSTSKSTPKATKVDFIVDNKGDESRLQRRQCGPSVFGCRMVCKVCVECVWVSNGVESVF